MPTLAFADTETTGLDWFNDQIWEVAIITRVYDFEWNLRERRELVWNPWIPDFDPDAFGRTAAGKITRFLDRKDDIIWSDRARAAEQICRVLKDAILIANCSTFDEIFFARFLRDNITVKNPSKPWTNPWFYHAIDIYSATFGFARGEGSPQILPGSRSEAVASYLEGHLQPPSDNDRHTAIGDARWVERWWDTLGLTPPPGTSNQPVAKLAAERAIS